MIVVKLELVPGGTGKPKQLGELRLWNVAGDSEVADYHGTLELDEQVRPIKVERHRRADGPWKLVLLALDGALTRWRI